MTVDVKETETRKGGLTLEVSERTKVAENHPATQSASALGLNEEEVRFSIEYAAGEFMGNGQRSYQNAFPDKGANYASVRSSELLKRERVARYVQMISVALMERLILENGAVERLEDWRQDALEAKKILRAARRRQIRLTSVESNNLQYTVNRALGAPVQIADVTHRDEAQTIQALQRYAQRVDAERRRVVGESR